MLFRSLTAAAILIATALLLDGRHEPVYQLGTADIHPVRLGPLVGWLTGGARFVSPEEARARRERLQRRLSQGQAMLAGLRKALETAGLPGRQALAGWALSLRARGLQASLREQTLDQYLPFILYNSYI